MAMFTACFDASGHESDQKHLTVGGFISSAKDWEDFSVAWKDRLQRDGLSYFHMNEFAPSTGPFSHFKNQELKRRALFGDLMGLIRTHVYRKFCCAVTIADWKGQVSPEMKERFRINAYVLAARSCTTQVREWCLFERINSPVAIVFERGDIGRGMLEAQFRKDELPDPLFRPKKDWKDREGNLIEAGYLPLQAADILAYESFLAVSRRNDDRWGMQELKKVEGFFSEYTESDLAELENKLQWLSAINRPFRAW
jgi:hypothetical protein